MSVPGDRCGTEARLKVLTPSHVGLGSTSPSPSPNRGDGRRLVFPEGTVDHDVCVQSGGRQARALSYLSASVTKASRP